MAIESLEKHSLRLKTTCPMSIVTIDIHMHIYYYYYYLNFRDSYPKPCQVKSLWQFYKKREQREISNHDHTEEKMWRIFSKKKTRKKTLWVCVLHSPFLHIWCCFFYCDSLKVLIPIFMVQMVRRAIPFEFNNVKWSVTTKQNKTECNIPCARCSNLYICQFITSELNKLCFWCNVNWSKNLQVFEDELQIFQIHENRFQYNVFFLWRKWF